MKTIIKNRYGVTPNALLNRDDVSLKAKGLYAYIQSKPDGWDFTISKIASQSKEGELSIRGAIKELEECGYLIRNNYQLENGTWTCEYHLFGTPTTPKPLKQPHSGLPHTDEPHTDDPYSDNRHTLVRKISKEEKQEREDLGSGTSKDVSKLVPLLIKEMESVDAKNKQYYRNTTQRDACKFLITEYGFEIVKNVIQALPTMKSKIPYFPSITTPCELRDKWVKIKDAIDREKLKGNKTEVLFS